MHLSVQRTFLEFLDAYLPGKEVTKVLEIGAQNFNGGLADLKPKNFEWHGLDIVNGPGVDTVINVGENYPFEEHSFDLVVASSVFEHDIQFWDTFIQMSPAVKPKGFVLLIMPSQGSFHRYPLDAFRFYPDASLALEKWAQRQGEYISLIESFTTSPEDEIWADYVAIYSGNSNFQAHEHLIGGKLNSENWIIRGILQPDTYQEFPYELRKIQELEALNSKLQNELIHQEYFHTNFYFLRFKKVLTQYNLFSDFLKSKLSRFRINRIS